MSLTGGKSARWALRDLDRVVQRGDLPPAGLLRENRSGQVCPAIARKAGQIAQELDKRILFSGAFRAENVVAALALTIGLAVIVSKLFPDEALPGRAADGAVTSGRDPFNPSAYPDFGSTQRRQRCFQQYWYGAMTPQGRDAFMSTPRTFTQCVYY